MKHFLLFIFLPLSFIRLSAQVTVKSPTAAVNNTGTGTLAWGSAGNVLSSNNAYATVAASGNTNYLFATNFGFALSGPQNIDGIELQIEKSELSPIAVSILDSWSIGLIKTVSAGTNRCLVVIAGIENGNSYLDITSMTYGGRAMTQVLDVAAGTSGGFSDRMEVWMLLESEIVLATGTSIIPTYAASTLLENVESFTGVVFQNVDQFNPVYSSVTTANNSSANPHQSAAFNTLTDGMSITGVVCGNNMTPAATTGGTNTYTINSSFTEGTDIYDANAGFATSGICIETATKACVTSGTEQPVFTFAGSVNRSAMFGLTLQRARAFDNAVYLLNANVITGNNYATSISWPVTDAYVTYGGPADTWGRVWSAAEINSTGFGSALSASRSNGDLTVDHFLITVYSTSTLPIELLEFTATVSENAVLTNWVTATEENNDYFEIERASEDLLFASVGRVDGSGNSSMLLSYAFVDVNPLSGVSYYRLKQVDFNGMYSYSQIVVVNYEPTHEPAIYPNPSIGVFNFLQDAQSNTNEVAVFSSDMKLVKKVTIAPGEKTIITIADEPNGIYFLIYDVNGVRQVRKVQKVSKAN
jgi:hypothetical protein